MTLWSLEQSSLMDKNAVVLTAQKLFYYLIMLKKIKAGL